MKKKAVEYTIKATKKDFVTESIKSSVDASNYARKFYSEDILIYESVFIILLNRANNVMGYAKISQGGVCGSVVDNSIIAKFAIDSLAKGVIIVHNHPSGNLRPSLEDISMSTKLKNGLSFLDITLVDSIILNGDGEYFSFKDEGKL